MPVWPKHLRSWLASITSGSARRVLLDELRQDIRYTARLSRKQPGFAAAVLLMLALGIGATTAIFSVVNSVLINPLPYPDSDALVSIVHTVDGRDEAYFGDAIYTLYTEQNRTFRRIRRLEPLRGGGDRHRPGRSRGGARAGGEPGTPDGARCAARNRAWFSAVDDTPGIAGHGDSHQWLLASDVRRRSRRREACPYHQLTSSPDHRRDARGVPLRRRSGQHHAEDVVFRHHPAAADRPSGAGAGLAAPRRGQAEARRHGGAGQRRCRSHGRDLVGAFRADEWPSAFRNTRYGASLRPLKQDVVGNVGRTLWVLMGTIGIVLLMACANVANLLLVRADARRQEFAIRAALGARWTRVARALLVESLTLAVLGGALGVGLAYGGLRVLVAIGPVGPASAFRDLDRRGGPRLRPVGFAVVRTPVRAHPDPQVRRTATRDGDRSAAAAPA